jgi:hypothetical protein
MSTGLIHRADQLELLVAAVRATVGGQADWPRTAHLVGELERHGDSYRPCYVRGPEEIVVELAEQIG